MGGNCRIIIIVFDCRMADQADQFLLFGVSAFRIVHSAWRSSDERNMTSTSLSAPGVPSVSGRTQFCDLGAFWFVFPHYFLPSFLFDIECLLPHHRACSSAVTICVLLEHHASPLRRDVGVCDTGLAQ